MYYLQSRYYDPETGRFINGDNYPTTGQGLLGNNMFAYCGNNPIIRADTHGEAFFTVLGTVIGAVTGMVDAAMMGKNVGRGAIAGAVGGFFSGLGIDAGLTVTVASEGAAVGWGVAIAGALGAAGNMISTAISSKGEASALEYVGAGLVGGITNVLSFGLAPGAKDIIKLGAKTVVGGIWEAGMKDIVNNIVTGTIVAEAATWINRVMNGVESK